ncbi:MAG: histidinol dehydrogenase [bacterium]|nr:histidinol dehydrogenase [Candidatus Margulisiibacteriota bacterium]
MFGITSREDLQAVIVGQQFKLHPEQEAVVGQIINEVSLKGDKALVDLTKKFDKKGFSKKELKITPAQIEAAAGQVVDGFKASLAKAIENIKAFHKKQHPDEWFETLPLDVVLGQRVIPLNRIGVYVPGGLASYPSSVLMGAIPAQVAGVAEVVIVSPPPINPHVLVAAAELGISEIYQVGGAQAIAALALGTETIPRVDKIVGPGNIFVTLAKKMLYGLVDIDSLAGPSNVVIIADKDAEPEFIAADLLAQAEHDPAAFAVLMSDSKEIIEKTLAELEKQLPKLSRQEIVKQAEIKLLFVSSIDEAVEISNQIAPEHLELMIGSPQRVLENIKNAGAVFLGPHSPVPVGDYLAGPSHVLPTGGTARFASPLGVYDFVKTQSIIGYTKPALKNVWKDIKLLAEIEGLDAHARAVDVRFS